MECIPTRRRIPIWRNTYMPNLSWRKDHRDIQSWNTYVIRASDHMSIFSSKALQAVVTFDFKPYLFPVISFTRDAFPVLTCQVFKCSSVFWIHCLFGILFLFLLSYFEMTIFLFYLFCSQRVIGWTIFVWHSLNMG